MQKVQFLNGEGDQWYKRNQGHDMDHRVKRDLVLKEISRMSLRPESVLEIGCAEGWRLNEISKVHGSHCSGLDPSLEAIDDGKLKYPNLNLFKGTADNIDLESDSCDLVIIGFCLYLCDRDDLFKIACEVDRVLKNNGYLMILDFHSEIPYKNGYSHCDGISSYKMDYTKMFEWNPNYLTLSKIAFNHDHEIEAKVRDDKIAISCLKKSKDQAYLSGISF